MKMRPASLFRLFRQHIDADWKSVHKIEKITGGGGGGGGVDKFTELTDVPGSYVDQGGKIVSVKGSEDGLEFQQLTLPFPFIDLSDVPASYVDQGGKSVRVKASEDGLEFSQPPFISLPDVPQSYADQALKLLRINAAEDAVETVDPAIAAGTPPDFHYYRRKNDADLERWYPVVWSTMAGGVGTPNAGIIWALPLIISKATNIDRIGFRITTALANSLLDFALYADNGNIFPGALVASLGTVACTSIGFKSLTVNQALAVGLHWLCFWTKLAPSFTMQGLAAYSPGAAQIGFSSAVANSELAGRGYYRVLAYTGTWPDPFPTIAEGTFVETAAPVLIVVRFTI
jgi:hypothetical protein